MQAEYFSTTKLPPYQRDFFKTLNEALDVLYVDADTFDKKFQSTAFDAILQAVSFWSTTHNQTRAKESGHPILAAVHGLAKKRHTPGIIGRLSGCTIPPVEIEKSYGVLSGDTLKLRPVAIDEKFADAVTKFYSNPYYSFPVTHNSQAAGEPNFNILQSYAKRTKCMENLNSGHTMMNYGNNGMAYAFNPPSVFFKPVLEKTMQSLAREQKLNSEDQRRLNVLLVKLEQLLPSCMTSPEKQEQAYKRIVVPIRDKDSSSEQILPFALNETTHKVAFKLCKVATSRDWKEMSDKAARKEVHIKEYLWKRELLPIIESARTIIPIDPAVNRLLDVLFDNSIIAQALALNAPKQPVDTKELLNIRSKLKETVDALIQYGHQPLTDALRSASTLLVMAYGTPENCRQFHIQQNIIIDNMRPENRSATRRSVIALEITKQEALIKGIIENAGIDLKPDSPHRQPVRGR